ncbi:MAG: DUF4157 domain-containing protein [Calothrix sp. C42_A2020_038]|nr:DUF4157 domain-containing protein [Calothrix sp. C42_A2020_038]
MTNKMLTQTKAKPSFMPVRGGLLQRQCASCNQQTLAGSECNKCQKNKSLLQRRATSLAEVGEAPPIVHKVLNSLGQPLDADSRNFMESRFGHDFSSVRVHTDAKAAESAQAVNALAYTVGRNVVFGTGQFTPRTHAGKRLLAHELTHVVQQSSQSNIISPKLNIDSSDSSLEREADNMAEAVVQNTIVSEVKHRHSSTSIQREKADEADCPGYQEDEVRISYTSTGHLEPDVTLIAPGRLLIADFGVDWSSVKRSAQAEPLLQSWFSTFESNDSYRLRIIGYSDCVGAEHNTSLRHNRAEHVERLLGSRARSRVTFRGMADLSNYVTNNTSVTNRAKNRGVVIEFYQEFNFPEDHITVTPKNCGPDVTQWLINQMNTNRNHPVIRTMRETRWPRYVPFFNLGWTAAALYDFAQLVRGGGPWDFKSHSRSLGWRVDGSRSCPTTNCDRTVTMCGMCFNYDVPGNIHFGWVGRAAELRSWLLHFGAGIVQPGRWTDDPKDAVGVAIGEAMWDRSTFLCDELSRRRTELNLDRTENCSPCS